MNKITHPKINNPKLIRSRDSKVISGDNTFLKRPTQSTKKKIKRVSFIRLVILLLVISAIIFGTYLILKTSYVFVSDLSKNTFAKVSEIKEEINLKQFEKVEVLKLETKILSQEDIVKSLGNIIKLPKEEMSVFAKVKDPVSLEKESSFYAGIKRGDYIVVYPSLAVIYDAEQEKVIRSMPIK